MDNMVFKNLGEAKAKKLYDELIKQGMSEDDAFTEVYAVECGLDDWTSLDECINTIATNEMETA